MIIKYLFLICFATLSFQLSSHYTAHKNPQLAIYLNMIGANLDEKTEIVQHINRKPNGIYLDLGTGGDGIATIVKKIDHNANTTLIAGDIDPGILKQIPLRHPEIVPWLKTEQDDQVKLKLILQEMDATFLRAFKDESISGINASALVHEIVSYANGFAGASKFIKEAFRVLGKDGVLVYRDPECVENREEIITADILSVSFKQFANIFLPKFLDKIFTNIVNKTSLYKQETVFFEFYKKGEDKVLLLDYKEYITFPTRDIEFQKPYRIIMPYGLCKELERHYIMFLHEYASLLFVTANFDVERNAYQVVFRALRARLNFIDYCLKLGIPIRKDAITVDAFQALRVYQLGLLNYLNAGLILTAVNRTCLSDIKNIFKSHGFDFEKYIAPAADKGGLYILDFKIVALLWNYLKDLLLNSSCCSFVEDSKNLLQWLQREGEESYYYASPAEFIAYVGRETINYNINYANGEQIYMLAPINPDCNKSIVREGYSAFLSESIHITNKSGLPLKHEDRKRIIHFGKISISAALRSYKKIIEIDPTHNEPIKVFVNELERIK